MVRTPLIAGTALLAFLGGRTLGAQPLPQSPDTTFVAATSGYEFHIDFWHNLHDYLYWRAQDDGPTEEGAACIASRPETERAAWRAAEEHYRVDMKDRHWRRDPLMRATRYTLSGEAPQPESAVEPLFDHLRRAAPTYRACFWERHRSSAQERLAGLLPYLVTLGPAAKRSLEALYDAPWPSVIHVDVVPYASYAGANTASGRDVPPHMQISSIDESLAGLSGVELLLHEASHEIFGLGRGLVGETIGDVSRALGVDPPRDLWHATSFFTTGFVMQEITARRGLEYTPYWDRTGLMRRAWPDYLEPLQTHWTPYLRRDVAVDVAMRNVVSAITR